MPFRGQGRARDNIDEIIAYISALGLTVSSNATGDLSKFRSRLDGLAEDHRLTVNEAAEISGIIVNLRLVLRAEMTGQVSYIVADKRHSVSNLMDDPGNLLAPGALQKLCPIGRHDFSEAAKCIAFERPTAAAFHLIRCVEAELREYYCAKIRKNRGPLMWANIIQKLRTKKNVSKTLLDHLDNLRANFRNPTQHPEKTYELGEVQDLLGVCVDILNRLLASKN